MKNRRCPGFGLALDGIVQCLIVDTAALDFWGRCDLILRSAARLIMAGAAVYRSNNDLATDLLFSRRGDTTTREKSRENCKLKSGSLKT